VDAGDWIALGGTVLALVFHSIGVAMFMARIAARTETNSKAIEALIATKVSTEQGAGYQAQLNRLENGAAECEGRINQMRQEFDGRQEHLTIRLNAHEQATTAQTSQLTNALTRLEEHVKSLKESIDRLSEAERQRAAQPQAQPLDIIGLLTLATQAAPLVRQIIARPN